MSLLLQGQTTGMSLVTRSAKKKKRIKVEDRLRPPAVDFWTFAGARARRRAYKLSLPLVQDERRTI